MTGLTTANVCNPKCFAVKDQFDLTVFHMTALINSFLLPTAHRAKDGSYAFSGDQLIDTVFVLTNVLRNGTKLLNQIWHYDSMINGL